MSFFPAGDPMQVDNTYTDLSTDSLLKDFLSSADILKIILEPRCFVGSSVMQAASVPLMRGSALVILHISGRLSLVCLIEPSLQRNFADSQNLEILVTILYVYINSKYTFVPAFEVRSFHRHSPVMFFDQLPFIVWEEHRYG